MIMSKKLTPERIAEIEKIPLTYDDDCPQLTQEELKEFVPYCLLAHNTMPVKETISIKIDADILAMIKATGDDYQTRINQCLKKAVLSGDF